MPGANAWPRRRARRPTGAPPPLPRNIGFTGYVWLGVSLVVVGVGALWVHFAPYVIDHIDTAVLRVFARLRIDRLTPFVRWANASTSRWGLASSGLIAVALVAVFRRWRHLLVLLGAIMVVELAVQLLTEAIQRPRAYGVGAIAGWDGYATPSLPVAALTVILIGVAYTLVESGRRRSQAKIVIAVLVLGLATARMYLAVDHPSDIVFAVLLGVAIPVAMFRFFTPNDLFPVAYGPRGKAAHLDVGGRRGEAIRAALHDQLGLQVLDVQPVGLEGSGGSTPLRIRVTDEDGGNERAIFAKLYARSHVRADRWYKLGRTMLYGTLEDEKPFNTVRRFVEYEDYTLRLLGDYGFPTPEPLGICEITPSREYLIAMEFFDGAVEIGEADIAEHVIDEGLQMVRRMWDVGLAHRDIKPANLMVSNDELKLIDVFFVQVRPSPWRQAVDLANMMLVLALRSDAHTVYEHALRYFTPDELAEAFAAARGVASPTQLNQFLKQDGRDLLAEFKVLAPARPSIAVQRWSVRRVLLIVAVLFLAFLFVMNGVGLFFPDKAAVGTPKCDTGTTTILFAQSVPSALRVPCVNRVPLGWTVIGATARAGEATFTLSAGGTAVVTETLSTVCPARSLGAVAYPVEGGCITYYASVRGRTDDIPSPFAGGGLSVILRSDLVDHVARTEDLLLCGARAPCP
jgi:tRNA A-37 threonylcarbamoyl transferase component Bud32